MMPIVYTPTVGLACQQLRAHLPAPARHLRQRAPIAAACADVLANWPRAATSRSSSSPTASASWAWAISARTAWAFRSASSSLYTACAGVHPSACLPVLLDVGTNNPELLDDPLYLGLQQPRLARRSLRRARRGVRRRGERALPGRGDPVRGLRQPQRVPAARANTAIASRRSTTTSRAPPRSRSRASSRRCAITGGKLGEQTLLFQGAGEAATGIADLAVAAMVAEGLDKPKARKPLLAVRFAGSGRRQPRRSRRAQAAATRTTIAPVGTLLDAVHALRPTAIIGVAAVGGAFTEEVVRDDGRRSTSGPIVFALSNPTSKSECTATQAYRVVGRARALRLRHRRSTPSRSTARTLRAAAGQQLVHLPGRRPGRDRVRRDAAITDEMFMAAAHDARRAGQRGRPRAGKPVSAAVEHSRGFCAHRRGGRLPIASARSLARVPQPADLLAFVSSQMYEPHYASYVAK